jgi:hypothetical protein
VKTKHFTEKRREEKRREEETTGLQGESNKL